VIDERRDAISTDSNSPRLGTTMGLTVDEFSRNTGETAAPDLRSMVSPDGGGGDHQLAKTRSQVNSDYADRRRKAGYKQVTVWMTKATQDNLETLRERFGSKEAAVEASLEMAVQTNLKPPEES
jgi:hypothetical protein